MRSHPKLCALVIILVAGLAHGSSQPAHTQGTSCLVTTNDGAVQGVDNGASCAFLGVPYAAPPVDALRWRPPQPAAAWAPVTLNATAPPSNCSLVNPPGTTTTLGAEDCLRMIIWTPDPMPASPAPVMVWFHPGAFVAASANLAAQNGRRMAERTGTIVIATNYRLGPFGFLAHPALAAEDASYPSSGNYGLLDQRAALAWVRENIGAFGGDPDRVTISGLSAGGHSVSLHMVSPGSAGYFHRAIMQSGYASSRWPTLAEGEVLGARLATALGCTIPSEVLTCLRSKSRTEVLLALPTGQQQWAETSRAAWGPVVDGLEIPDQPRALYENGHFAHVPLIIGATRDEGWIYADRSFPAGLTVEQYEAAVQTEFAGDAAAILARYPVNDYPSPKHALSQIAGDFEAVCEAKRVARLVSRRGTPVFFYSFQREVAPVAGDQVIHGIDVNFVFGNNYGPPTPYILNAADLALSDTVMDFWTRFARTGEPNPAPPRGGRRSDAWPAFHGGSGRYIILDVPIRDDRRLREDACDFWDALFLRSLVGSEPAAASLTDLCGASVVADLKLDHDVACPGNGPSVAADGIRIDLNGHTISGSGVGSGIDVAGRGDVRITGGIIRNFFAGVRIADSSGVVVRDTVFIANTDGIDVQSGGIGNTIAHNEFRDNLSRGIMLRGNVLRNTIRHNTFAGNRVGILVFAGVDNVIRANTVSSSVLAGIRINVFASGNDVRLNVIDSNPAGVEFLITPTGSAAGNTVAGNELSSNLCGIKGPLTGNTIRSNRFKSNVTDTCP